MEMKTVYQTISEIFEDLADVLEKGSLTRKIKVGLTILGSEHGPQELINGAEMAQGKPRPGSNHHRQRRKTDLKRLEAATEQKLTPDG